jgi:protein TonB
MSFDSLDSPFRTANSRKLSQNGLLVAIGVYGFLVLVGFAFGIVTGYERPRPVAVAQHSKDKEQPRAAETPKGQPQLQPQPPGGPKLIPNTTPELRREEPRPEPRREDPKPEPKKDAPKPEPKAVETPKPAAKAVEPKKEAAVTISFEKQVRPILMRYCGDCHGNAGKPRGDVDLRTLAVITDPKNPPILVAGKPEKSAIYTTIADKSMPPDNKPRPGKGETDLIREWIATGAKPRRRSLRRLG